MFEQDVVGRASSLAASARGEESKGANLNVSLSSLVSNNGQTEPKERKE